MLAGIHLNRLVASAQLGYIKVAILGIDQLPSVALLNFINHINGVLFVVGEITMPTACLDIGTGTCPAGPFSAEVEHSTFVRSHSPTELLYSKIWQGTHVSGLTFSMAKLPDQPGEPQQPESFPFPRRTFSQKKIALRFFQGRSEFVVCNLVQRSLNLLWSCRREQVMVTPSLKLKRLLTAKQLARSKILPSTSHKNYW